MRVSLKGFLEIFKFFTGTLAVFLIFCGIHWIAILSGVVLGAIYYCIPKR